MVDEDALLDQAKQQADAERRTMLRAGLAQVPALKQAVQSSLDLGDINPQSAKRKHVSPRHLPHDSAQPRPLYRFARRLG